MTNRFAAVLVTSQSHSAMAPPGIDPGGFRLALLEDTYEVVAGLDSVVSVLALSVPDEAAEMITWPGTPILRVAAAVHPLSATYAAMEGLGADEALIIAADVPDLPSLLLGKLFRALGAGDVAICPARGGGLVAMAARLPAPAWLAGVDLDTPDAPARLRAAAQRHGAVRSGPGWHRLRAPADLRFLDPGLEGWDNTRALLAGHPL